MNIRLQMLMNLTPIIMFLNIGTFNLRKSVKVEDSALITFRKESDFKKELKKLNLPEKFLNPEEVYEQYKNDPVLPWFPEKIKKELEKAKTKKSK